MSSNSHWQATTEAGQADVGCGWVWALGYWFGIMGHQIHPKIVWWTSHSWLFDHGPISPTGQYTVINIGGSQDTNCTRKSGCSLQDLLAAWQDHQRFRHHGEYWHGAAVDDQLWIRMTGPKSPTTDQMMCENSPCRRSNELIVGQSLGHCCSTRRTNGVHVVPPVFASQEFQGPSCSQSSKDDFHLDMSLFHIYIQSIYYILYFFTSFFLSYIHLWYICICVYIQKI